MNAIGDNKARRGWIGMGKRLPRPRAVVAVSAHWETEGTKVRTAADNRQIFDMYGFPQELYDVRYEPEGSPEMAKETLRLLGSDGMEENSWGIDHGLWSVLSNIYPKADVPVVAVSIDVTADERRLYEIGRKLAPLRDEDVMILASGNIVHNLRLVDWDMQGGYLWADQVDRRIKDAVLSGNHEAILEWRKIPDARKAVPTVEHFFPFLVALGAVSSSDHAEVFNDYRELGSMSMTSYLFSES